MLVKNNTNTPHTIITKDGGVEVVEAFGEVEADLTQEYAALINAVGILTASQEKKKTSRK